MGKIKRVRHANKTWRDQIITMLFEGIEARRESDCAADVDWGSDWHLARRKSRTLFADCRAMAETYGLMGWYRSFIAHLSDQGVSGVPVC